MDFRKYENENIDAYIYRICENKGIMTWEEVADILNDELDYEYSSSKYRKAYQAQKKIIDLKQESLASLEDQFEELKELKEELRKERVKLQTLNLERNRITREDARQELFYEQIGQYIKSKECKKLQPHRIPKNKNMKYLLGIADVHAGAKWATNTNEYDMKIVHDRFEILLEEVESFIDDKQLDELNIALLGDLIDGCLRMSNLQTMDSTVSKAIADISDIIIDFIEQLIEDKQIHINLFDVVYGNHSTPRFLQNYDIKEDLGYTINRYIRKGLRKNENVDIYSPIDGDMYLDFKIWDFNFIGFHGHTEKNQSEAIKDLTLQRRVLYDYAICGHLHSSKGTTNTIGGTYDVETIQFPSFVGDDPYGNSIHKVSKGACMICGFDKDYGWIETNKIILN